MHLRRLAALVLTLALGQLACAHHKPKATLASLRSASDTYLRYLRWNDLRGAAQMLVAESQQAWLDEALDAKDDENLKVTDCELDDLRLAEPGKAVGEAKVTWHRLPSVTTRTDRVVVHWVDRDGSWFVSSVKSGPLPLTAAPVPDAGVPSAPPAEQKSEPRAL